MFNYTISNIINKFFICTHVKYRQTLPFNYIIYILVLNLSYPAVSHICILTVFPFKSNVLILKSTPIVGKKLSLKIFSENRSNKLDLPTQEFPISNSLKR